MRRACGKQLRFGVASRYTDWKAANRASVVAEFLYLFGGRAGRSKKDVTVCVYVCVSDTFRRYQVLFIF